MEDWRIYSLGDKVKELETEAGYWKAKYEALEKLLMDNIDNLTDDMMQQVYLFFESKR